MGGAPLSTVTVEASSTDKPAAPSPLVFLPFCPIENRFNSARAVTSTVVAQQAFDLVRIFLRVLAIPLLAEKLVARKPHPSILVLHDDRKPAKRVFLPIARAGCVMVDPRNLQRDRSGWIAGGHDYFGCGWSTKGRGPQTRSPDAQGRRVGP
jgi:hypothetical protein